MNPSALDARKSIQEILHVAEDGVIGARSLQALTLLSKLPNDAAWPPGDPAPVNESGAHEVTGSSFADPSDVAAFHHCKASGGSDIFCFGKGDNGIGKWGDDCTAGSGPACALPPEDWAQFGTAARNRQVLVKRPSGQEVICFLRDTMPHRENITNGAGIDLNPDACSALGLTPPVMADVTWQWADETAPAAPVPTTPHAETADGVE